MFFAPYGPHKPKRSATADRKEAPSANRANRRTISAPFSVSCAAFEFICLHVRNIALCKMEASEWGTCPDQKTAYTSRFTTWRRHEILRQFECFRHSPLGPIANRTEHPRFLRLEPSVESG